MTGNYTQGQGLGELGTELHPQLSILVIPVMIELIILMKLLEQLYRRRDIKLLTLAKCTLEVISSMRMEIY